MSRVLVTGVAGFLGSHLAMHCLNRGDEVVGVDDHSTSLGSTSPNLIALNGYRMFTFIQGDVIDRYPILADGPTGLGRQDFDLVFNFACPASPPRYQAMPIHTLMTCVLGVKNVLEHSLGDGAIVVHASTSEVYGDPLNSVQVETDWGNVNSYGPRSCYDEGKRAAEALCYDYRKLHNVDVKIVRIFNTYGPGMDPDDGRVVTNFIKQALTDQDITVYGDGSQTRSFCFVDDLCDGILRLSMSDSTFSGPVNIGNPTEFTIDELAAAVIEAVPGTKSKVVYKPLPIDDPRQRRPNIELAQKALGWEPRVNLEEGLQATVKYMEKMRPFFNRSWTPCHKR